VIPHFDQYLGWWAMREDEFLAGHALLMGLDLHLHMQGPDPQRARDMAEEYGVLSVQEGVAVIALHGMLMKQQSSASDSTSTVQARRLVRAARTNPDVQAALLHIDSPGGTVSGLQPLVEDVAALAAAKPTIAQIENLGASAAYRVASQANKVIAGRDSLVGSIGTYGVVQDMSAAATLKGIKVHVIKAGAMKGAGVPGTEVTADQLADQQRIVNDLNDSFVRDVSTGRGLSQARARELADGRVHIAAKAQELGLIDGVQSLDATWSKLVAFTKRRKSA
jgi:signal peptide peptidase SppA